jgi:hypothetical protein
LHYIHEIYIIGSARGNEKQKSGASQPDTVGTVGTNGTALTLEAIASIESVSREDAMADAPADADALESDDIPRSMAEIYRISNRNRKRNKEKKKTKDDAGEDDDDISKRLKKSAVSSSTSGPVKGGDDAVKFMLDIGWVDNASIPVAQPATNASGEILRGGGRGGRQSHDSESGGGRGGSSKRHGKPHSPRRRTPTHRGSSGNNKGGRQFDYSQGAAAAAGAVAPASSASSSSASRGNRRGGRGGGSGGRSNSQAYHG